MAQSKTMSDLFEDTLKDVYFAEQKILGTLPKMAAAAQDEDLKAAFETHREETEGQIQRLEEVFGLIEKKPQGKTCPAILGIIEEGSEIMKEYAGSPALDSALLAAAQAVEHYEIARYTSLCAWAETLGMEDAVALLQVTLDEEEATDEALALLGESINDVAAEEEEESA